MTIKLKQGLNFNILKSKENYTINVTTCWTFTMSITEFSLYQSLFLFVFVLTQFQFVFKLKFRKKQHL